MNEALQCGHPVSLVRHSGEFVLFSSPFIVHDGLFSQAIVDVT
jgi:hypothetical protein